MWSVLEFSQSFFGGSAKQMKNDNTSPENVSTPKFRANYSSHQEIKRPSMTYPREAIYSGQN
jgi:hypothetical protein